MWPGESRQIVFVRLVHGVLTRVGAKRVKVTDDNVKFKKHGYIFDAAHPAYKVGSTVMYYIDVDTGATITMGKPDETCKIDADLIDAVCVKHVAKDIVLTNVSAMMHGTGFAWYIVLIVMGVFGGMLLQAVFKLVPVAL